MQAEPVANRFATLGLVPSPAPHAKASVPLALPLHFWLPVCRTTAVKSCCSLMTKLLLLQMQETGDKQSHCLCCCLQTCLPACQPASPQERAPHSASSHVCDCHCSPTIVGSYLANSRQMFMHCWQESFFHSLRCLFSVCSGIFASGTANKLGRLSQLTAVVGDARALAVELDFASTILPKDNVEMISNPSISGLIGGQPVKAGIVALQVTRIACALSLRCWCSVAACISHAY